MSKFQPLIDAGTNGMNFGLDTDDVVKRLDAWDKAYGVAVSDVKHDAVTVRFDSLPDDTMAFAQEVYAFCPDTVDQHFGCIAEMIDAAEEMGQGVPDHLAEMIEGVDLDSEDYGVELLRRSIEKTKAVGLWWD